MRHKEGLVKWLQEQAARVAATEALNQDARIRDITKKWIWEAIAIAKQEVTEKSDKGTEIHDLLERFHDNPFELNEDEQKLCYAIVDCIKENTGLSLFDDFIPEKSFGVPEYGYGGMCDLHTKPIVETKWVLDYKTKDEVTEKTRGYDEQGEQLAAYSHGLGMPEARLGNLFIPREPDENGEYYIKFFEHKKPDEAWCRFKHTLQLWHVLKKFQPFYDHIVGGNQLPIKL